MRSLVLTAALGAVCLLVASLGAPGRAGLLFLLGGPAQASSPARSDNRCRMGAALGRVGSILGPAIAGLLLALQLNPNNIILVTAIPALIAMACAFGLSVLERRVSLRVASAGDTATDYL